MADPANSSMFDDRTKQLLGLVNAQQPTGTMDKISNFIGNPLVSGALGAYLGTIGQPRREGLGHALSIGGLQGLGAFNQARQYQLQAPLNRIKMAEGIAGTEQKLGSADKSTSGAALDRQRTADLQQGVIARDNAIRQLKTEPSFIKLDPVTQQLVIEGLQTGKINPDQLGITPKAQAETDKAKAETSKAQYETQNVLPSEVSEHQAQTTRAYAEAAKAGREGTPGDVKPTRVKVYNIADPSKTKMVVASGPDWSPETGWRLAGDAPPKGPAAAKPRDPTLEASTGLGNLEKARKEYGVEVGVKKRSLPESMGGYTEGDFASWLVHKKHLNPTTGRAIPPPPVPGAEYGVAPTGQYGYHDPNHPGQFYPDD